MAGARLAGLSAASGTRAVLLNPRAASHGIWHREFGRHHAGLSVHGASPWITPGAADASDRLGDCEAGVHLGYSQGRGSSNAPMRTAMSHIDLGLIRARHGDLDEAVHHGLTAFSYDRKTEASLTGRPRPRSCPTPPT
jgi:hypothetical protein